MLFVIFFVLMSEMSVGVAGLTVAACTCGYVLLKDRVRAIQAFSTLLDILAA